MRRLLRRLSPAVFGLVLLAACNGGVGDTGEGETGETGRAEAGETFNVFCGPQADWNTASIAFEDEVLSLVNVNRAMGASCGGVQYEPTEPLVADAQLRCAARIHSLDMFMRGFFAHDNPDGESPWDRVAKTDYSANATGENIALGYPTPADVMQGWMDSPGHCVNIMSAGSNELGVGYYDGYWTQVMGKR